MPKNYSYDSREKEKDGFIAKRGVETENWWQKDVVFIFFNFQLLYFPSFGNIGSWH